MEIETNAQDGLLIKSKTSIGNDSGINMDDSGHDQIYNGNTYTSDDLSLTSSPTSCHSDSQKDWEVVEDKSVPSKTQDVNENNKTNTTQIVVSSDSGDDVLSEEIVTEDVITPAFSAPRRPPPPAESISPDDDNTQQEVTPSEVTPSEVTPSSPRDEEPTESQPEEVTNLPAAEDEEELQEVGEEAVEDAIVPQVKAAKCMVEITVTDYSDEEVDQQPEPEPEVPAVEYPRGLVCEDVDTALEILKTRYRLSEIQSKKCVITLNSPWWQTDEVTQEPVVEAPVRKQIKDMEKRISRKEQEIEYLLKQVLDEEKRQKDEAEKKKQAQEAEVIEEAPKDEPVPDKKSKRKRGNVFQRMIIAIRKRLDRRNQAAA